MSAAKAVTNRMAASTCDTAMVVWGMKRVSVRMPSIQALPRPYQKK